MLNSYSRGGKGGNANVNINSISGTIVKNHIKSFILDYHLDSAMGKRLMVPDPKLSKRTNKYAYNNGYEDLPVVILQTMICGDLRVISEIMWKDDFDKIFFVPPMFTYCQTYSLFFIFHRCIFGANDVCNM